MCGGTIFIRTYNVVIEGLSPRVRRYPVSGGNTHFCRRSISACAEVPLPCPPELPIAAVYLRVCGGTGEGRRPRPGVRGLSPRVRRYPGCRPLLLALVGSISACAEVPLLQIVATGRKPVQSRCSAPLGAPRWQSNEASAFRPSPVCPEGEAVRCLQSTSHDRWARGDLNPRPIDYESTALTN